MLSFSQLHAQNHRITELSNVFLHLSQKRSLCDTETACGLFFDYAQQVKEHMEFVDKQLCSRLIAHPDPSVRNTADRFLSGSSEIKRIFADYLKDWCRTSHRELRIHDHEAFVRDTEHMFALVLDRIQRETELLYPLIRKIEGDEQAA